MKVHEILTELFDERNALPLQWERYSSESLEANATAYDRQGKELVITFVPITTNDSNLTAVDIEFTRAGSYDVTGRGDAELILGTVISAIKTYLKEYGKPKIILFSAKELSRSKLYQRMINRFVSPLGYKQVPFSQLPGDITSIPGYGPDIFALIKD